MVLSSIVVTCYSNILKLIPFFKQCLVANIHLGSMNWFCIFFFISVSVLAQTPVEKAKKLWQNKNPSEARKILLTIDEDSKDYAESRFYLGRIAYDEKDYDEAEEYFEEAVEENDKVAEYYNFLGNTYGLIAQDGNIIKQGMYVPKMRDAWKRTIELDPKHVEAHWSLLQFYTRAPGFIGGSFAKAMEMANTIKKLNVGEGHRAIGTVYLREKKYAEAEKEFIAMAATDQKYVPTLANYYISQKQFSKAHALFEEALKKNPDDYMAIYQFGKVSALSGEKIDQGEAYLKKYLNHVVKGSEPSHAAANMRLAQIQEKKGNKAAAKKLYEEALKSDQTLEEARDGLKRLSSR